LVIEDSEAIRLPVCTVLDAQGFEVQGLKSGVDLEGRLGGFGPDLVILDVMLPGRDGFEPLSALRRHSRAAVLMLTARDSLADRVHGLSEGADDYLVKPFAMAELVARIHALATSPTGRQRYGSRRSGDQRGRVLWNAPVAARPPRPSAGCWAISPPTARMW
jgi:DNA-binding response OmpR family regulator